MQNKGFIKGIAIALALICVYQLFFTYKARSVEADAKEYAMAQANLVEKTQADSVFNSREKFYLDSISNENVYSLLWMADYTYREVKEQEINLGLDLRGGMNVTLEISVVDLLHAMSNYSKDETFNKAIVLAEEKQKNSQEEFVNLFVQSFEEADPNASLAAIFFSREMSDKINVNSTNKEVAKVLRDETDAAIENSFNILRTRIDRFGVAQPNIQHLSQKGRILVELPGVKDKQRVRKLLQGTASLEFWETYENGELQNALAQANAVIREYNDLNSKTVEATEVSSDTEDVEESKENDLLSEIEADASDSTASDIDIMKEYPLFSVLQPAISQNGQPYAGAVVGHALTRNRAQVDAYLALPQVREYLPNDVKFAWGQKPFTYTTSEGNTIEQYALYALKVTTRNGQAPLDGGVITDARQAFNQMGSVPEVDMTMNAEGAKKWARMTGDNVGRSIAIVLDDLIVSAPTVQGAITGGRSQITGQESIEEAQDLANMLKSGKMPAPAHIVEEYVVGPSLGEEAINSGLWSFVIAFILVLVYMLLIYSGSAGTAANLALIANLFFVFGVLASFGAVLTLPGLAGIVLTIGMSVDANVLIYERIYEEITAGKGVKLAIKDGYKNALSAIIDGQVTTLLTGIVLYFFGSGPIKGFATTLIIGICTSLFSAIFLTRIIFENRLAKGKKITFVSELSKNWLRGSKINFLEKRKVAYIISGGFILLGLISLTVRGLNYGIDFKGGRTYVVRFDEEVKVSDVRQALTAEFGSSPEVKTFGGDKQVRITTDYHIDDLSSEIDNDVENKLYNGLKPYLNTMSKDSFIDGHIMSSSKVGPTISDDIQKTSVIAITLALLIIFLYILVRFRNWQYGLGAIAALAHDTLFVLGIFSLLHGFMPFSLEIDQAFIAAILTVLGYSINDTVVVFDRIREFLGLHPKTSYEENTNNALNSTLRRTFSTSLSTFVVLLAIFIFGGATIRGFCFALLVGVIVGTYSSLFIATPISYDALKRANKIAAKRKK